MILPSLGCTLLGPGAIYNGRQAYNEAIVTTGEQQLLNAFVELRYGRLAGFLTVASVTANIRFAGSASAEFGFGSDQDFAGNLVPLGVGVAYEENPTISYVPIIGEAYIRNLMGPLPLDLFILMVSASLRADRIFLALVDSINGISNSGIRRQQEDPRFGRVARLISDLRDQDRLELVQEAGDQEFSMLVRPGGEQDGDIEELFDLLRLAQPEPGAEFVTVPIVLGAGKRGTSEIDIATRSVWELAHVFAANVDVPDEDLESGRVTVYPESPLSDFLHIHRSDSYPDDPAVAVPYRGGWYYIDDRDMNTKVVFQIAKALWQARISDSNKPGQAVPVLTIPVSR